MSCAAAATCASPLLAPRRGQLNQHGRRKVAPVAAAEAAVNLGRVFAFPARTFLPLRFAIFTWPSWTSTGKQGRLWAWPSSLSG